MHTNKDTPFWNEQQSQVCTKTTFWVAFSKHCRSQQTVRDLLGQTVGSLDQVTLPFFGSRLGLTLQDKSLQCSNWDQRPLSPEQICRWDDELATRKWLMFRGQFFSQAYQKTCGFHHLIEFKQIFKASSYGQEEMVWCSHILCSFNGWSFGFSASGFSSTSAIFWFTVQSGGKESCVFSYLSGEGKFTLSEHT